MNPIIDPNRRIGIIVPMIKMYSSKPKKYASNYKPIYIQPDMFLVKYQPVQDMHLTNANNMSTRTTHVYMKCVDQLCYP